MNRPSRRAIANRRSANLPAERQVRKRRWRAWFQIAHVKLVQRVTIFLSRYIGVIGIGIYCYSFFSLHAHVAGYNIHEDEIGASRAFPLFRNRSPVSSVIRDLNVVSSRVSRLPT